MAGEQRQQPREERAIVMEYTTGLPTAKFADLLTLIRLREEDVEGYPPSLGLRDSLRAVLIYMRHNVIQAVIGEQLGVSQSTISRAIGAVTDAIVRALKDVLLTAEEVPQGCDYVVDGTLFPCWSWRNHRELWSGKHKTTGMNVQILILPDGRLVRASDPYPGSMHDVAAPGSSGLLEGIDPSRWIADKGHIGRGIITPHKKPPNDELSEAAKEANKSINRIRRAERAGHRPHQGLENPPHRLPAPPAHIRADHHRRTLTPRLQNHPLNNLPGRRDVHFALESAVPTVVLECKTHISRAKCTSRRAQDRPASHYLGRPPPAPPGPRTTTPGEKGSLRPSRPEGARGGGSKPRASHLFRHRTSQPPIRPSPWESQAATLRPARRRMRA